MHGSKLLDEVLPVYDVSDGVALVADADPQTAWDAVLATDLVQLGKRRPLVGLLGAVRALPEIVGGLLRGRKPAKPPQHLTLLDTASLRMGDGGWVLLGRRDGEIALGLVGRFWRPVIEFADVADADAFRAFSRPGFAKTVYAVAAEELEPGTTLLTAGMRTATTDDHARRWFRRYWALGVGAGAHVLARALLEEARDAAERASERSG
jgi:hypothetical protein